MSPTCTYAIESDVMNPIMSESMSPTYAIESDVINPI